MRAIVSVQVVAPLLTLVLLAALVGGAVATRGPAADARGSRPLAVAGIQSPSPLSDTRPPRSPRPGQVVASTPAQTGPSQRPTRSERPLNSANAAGSAATASASAVAASDLAAFSSALDASASAVVASDTAVASESAVTASGSAAVASGSAAVASGSAGVAASDGAASASAGVVASDTAASASAGVVASDGAASASAGVVASDTAASASAGVAVVASASTAVASNAAASAAANTPPVTQRAVIYTGDFNQRVSGDLNPYVTNLPVGEHLTYADVTTSGCPLQVFPGDGTFTVQVFPGEPGCEFEYYVRDAAGQRTVGYVTIILGPSPEAAASASAAAINSAPVANDGSVVADSTGRAISELNALVVNRPAGETLTFYPVTTTCQTLFIASNSGAFQATLFSGRDSCEIVYVVIDSANQRDEGTVTVQRTAIP